METLPERKYSRKTRFFAERSGVSGSVEHLPGPFRNAFLAEQVLGVSSAQKCARIAPTAFR
jgi:hypothetical protein